MKSVNLFLWHAKIRVSRSMAYRSDFLVGLVVSLVGSSIGPLFQYLLFTNTRGYPGWTLNQLLMFQGLVLLFMGIKGLLFGNVGNVVSSMVWRGEFDRLLALPYKPINTLLASGFDLSQIGVLFTGLFLAIFGGMRLGVQLGIQQFLILLLSFSSGIFLYLAFMVFYCTIMVMVTKIGRFQEVIDTLFSFIGYPAEIFPRTVQIVLSTILPFLVIVYFPAQVLLDRATLFMVPGIILCFLFFIISLQIWKRKLKKYSSAGG